MSFVDIINTYFPLKTHLQLSPPFCQLETRPAEVVPRLDGFRPLRHREYLPDCPSSNSIAPPAAEPAEQECQDRLCGRVIPAIFGGRSLSNLLGSRNELTKQESQSGPLSTPRTRPEMLSFTQVLLRASVHACVRACVCMCAACCVPERKQIPRGHVVCFCRTHRTRSHLTQKFCHKLAY